MNEDLYDARIAKERADEPRVSLDQVRARLFSKAASDPRIPATPRVSAS